ncbi:MAG: 2OG-Fe(II) oxygenase [Microbacteriaceae bacterium]|nr:2OG-Fe(II) oxygenase [Microbacteriaceae bacterium]NBS60819.1 2OG-Fe(II) oxygenase [Microbacteriaceae bacterium]
MNKYYEVYNEFIPHTICDYIISEAQMYEPNDATVGTYNNLSLPEHRISTVRWLPPFNNYVTPFLLTAALNSNKHWEYIIDPELVAIQFTEYYGTLKGHFNWHNDILLDKSKHRKVSVILQLSDPTDYEGGFLEMENWVGFNNSQAEIAFKKRGSVLVFPSILQHRVSPVTLGTRYSVVTWLEGPQFK